MFKIEKRKKSTRLIVSFRYAFVAFSLNLFLFVGARFQVGPCVTLQKFATLHVNLFTQQASLYLNEIAISLQSFPEMFRHRHTIIALTAENHSLKKELTALRKLCIEHASLEDFVKSHAPHDYQTICRVIFSSSHAYLQSLVINTGETIVQAGQAVTTDNGLIGQITDVNPPFATVRLLSDPRSHLPVKIGEDAEGVLSGSGTAQPYIHTISKIDMVKANIPIVTLSSGAHIPANIPIGVTKSVHSNNNVAVELAETKVPTHVMILPPIDTEIK